MAEPAFVDAYEGLVCDLDGVVYRGDDAVPGAPEALRAVRGRGVHVVYATNNASRVPADVARQLAELGAPGGADDVVTSAQAGAARLASTLDPGSRVLALGGEGVSVALREAGLRPVRPAELRGDDDGPCDAVLQGLGRQLTVADFEVAARLLAAGTLWVATNDDATLPLPWGDAPGNGAYVALLAAATRRQADVVGKPHPPLYRLAADRLGSTPSRVLAVGDRLDTDVAGAREAGLDAAWVLTGVDVPSALLSTDLHPTVVVATLDELLEPLAAPERHDGSWVCGGARAAWQDGTLRLEAGPAPADGVRAGLAALVAARDAGDDPRTLADAAQQLDRLVAPGR